MSKFHVELGGFAGFDTIEEARAFAVAMEELLEARSENNATGCKIRNMATQTGVSVVAPTYDNALVYVGLQGANTRVNQLANHAKKFTSLDVNLEWHELILNCVNNRYSVDEGIYIQICTSNLKDDVTALDFIESIPEEKIVTAN